MAQSGRAGAIAQVIPSPQNRKVCIQSQTTIGFMVQWQFSFTTMYDSQADHELFSDGQVISHSVTCGHLMLARAVFFCAKMVLFREKVPQGLLQFCSN